MSNVTGVFTAGNYDWKDMYDISNSVFVKEDRWSRDIFYGWPAKNILVYKIDDKIVGYLCFREVVGGWSIANFGVRKEHQKKGIGKMLMDQMIKSHDGDLYLHVNTDNEPAFKLYKKLGFEIAEKLENYYGVGRHGYLMERKDPNMPQPIFTYGTQRW